MVKFFLSNSNLILCVERVGEDHAMVPETKSYYISIQEDSQLSQPYLRFLIMLRGLFTEGKSDCWGWEAVVSGREAVVSVHH